MKLNERCSDAQMRTLLVIEALIAYSEGQPQAFIQYVQRLWPRITWQQTSKILTLFPHEHDDQEMAYIDLIEEARAA